MPKKKGVRVTIIVEDEALERFSREVLIEFGFSRHELRVEKCPAGKGSAKDWVNKRYPVEVQIMRSKAHQNLGVVVGTDVDELSVIQRAGRLAEALQNADVEARRGNEQIVFWMPKWNIETWILYFSGDVRDEDGNYKDSVRNPDYPNAARAFFEEYRNYKVSTEIETQPSLRSAYEETKRLNV